VHQVDKGVYVPSTDQTVIEGSGISPVTSSLISSPWLRDVKRHLEASILMMVTMETMKTMTQTIDTMTMTLFGVYTKSPPMIVVCLKKVNDKINYINISITTYMYCYNRKA